MSEVVARGKIKVDARKAVEKLRDHMLVDLHHYACEIARVAVASGATDIAVTYDADDTIFTWSGRTLAPEAIARARDHVLAPTEGEEGDVLRILGVAISAALGLDPSFVDVIVGTTRVRFEPGEENAPITTVTTGVVGTTRIHVRRSAGIGTFGRAFKDEAPREVRALLATTRDAPLTVTVRGKRPELSTRPEVVLRVDLDEPAATRAVLEVLTPSEDARASTVFLERGVQLAAYTTLLGSWIDPAGIPFPMRLVVDAKKLPTNASRSEIRLEADLVRRVVARVPAAIDAAIAALGGGNGEGFAIERLARHERAYEEALGAIVTHVALAVRMQTLPESVRALLALPVLRTATDAPLTPLGLAGGVHDKPLVVHTGEAVERELEPWLVGVAWDRGRAADRIYETLVRVPADKLVAMAREGHARRKRALEHPASPPVLGASAAHVLREAFAVREGPFAGLHGEIAILRRDGNYRRSATARVFVEERVLETMPLPGAALPVEMAIAWPGTIRARFAYDGVEPDPQLQRALVYALRVAAIAIGERMKERDAEIVRLAIAAWAGATKELADGPLTSAALGALADAPAWDTSSGRATTTRELEAYAKRTHAICVARTSGEAIDRRPVVHADQASLLAAFLPPKTRIVPYDAPLARRSFASRDQIARAAQTYRLFVRVQRSDGEGILGIGDGVEIVYHMGEIVRRGARASRFGPTALVYDDHAAVPAGAGSDTQTWTSVLDVVAEERTLLARFLDGCESGEIDPDSFGAFAESSLRAIESRATRSSAEEAFAVRLRAIPERARAEAAARAKAVLLATPAFDPLTDPRTLAIFEGIERAPRAKVTRPEGTMTVWLSRAASVWNGAPSALALLHHGRLATTTTGPALPVVAILDLTRDDRLDDAWKADLVVEGAVTIVVERWKARAVDLGLLRLACELAEAHPLPSARLVSAIGEAPWPTVQGGTVTLISLHGTIPWGADHYAPFRGGPDRSPYDEPVLHIPRGAEGDLVRRLLALAGYTLGDVTEHVARLQARRAQGTPPPRLSGETSVLRASLQNLGAMHVVGEIEVAHVADVKRVDERGVTAPVTLPLVAPVRAVFRADAGASDVAIAADLNAATARHARAIAKDLDALPPFANDAVRAVICASIRAGTMQRGDESLRLFRDTRGALHAYTALPKQIGITEDPPPYPEHDGVVIQATPLEARALGKGVEVVDRTLELRELARAAERRAAPPKETIALDAEVRAKCIFTFTIASDGIEGEIGLLAPAHQRLRGIDVHVTRRLLCRIPDGTGWPAVAALNDEAVTPTRPFDGLASTSDAGRLRSALRSAAAHALPGLLGAPPDALGVMRLPSGFLAMLPPSNTPVPCIGVLWLDPTWPERPEVHVEALDAIDPYRTPRLPSDIPKAHHRTPPVRGRLWVLASGELIGPSLEQVFRSVRTRIPPLIHAAGRSFKKPPKEVLEAYAWDLALLGLRDDRDPIAELAKDRPDPMLVHVATIRAPQLLRRADEPLAVPEAPAPDAREWLEKEIARAPETPETPETPPVAPSFLQGLVRRLVALVSPEPETLEDLAVVASLATALREMKLTGDPVIGVVEARRGRPVRYDTESKKVVLNTRHPSVKALATHPSRVLHLLVAAVSEINRELVDVSDAEELAIVTDLLRARDPAP